MNASTLGSEECCRRKTRPNHQYKSNDTSSRTRLHRPKNRVKTQQKNGGKKIFQASGYKKMKARHIKGGKRSGEKKKSGPKGKAKAPKEEKQVLGDHQAPS